MGYKVAPTTWKVSAKLSEMTGKLAALDRYERRALSRRKFAIREFEKDRQSSPMAWGSRFGRTKPSSPVDLGLALSRASISSRRQEAIPHPHVETRQSDSDMLAVQRPEIKELSALGQSHFRSYR